MWAMPGDGSERHWRSERMQVKLRHVPEAELRARPQAEPAVQVCLAETDWETLAPGEEVPPVDFGQEFLCIVHRGECPTGGYRVKVAGARRAGGHLLLETVLQDPRPDDFVTMAVTYPRCAVALARCEAGPPGAKLQVKAVAAGGKAIAMTELTLPLR